MAISDGAAFAIKRNALRSRLSSRRFAPVRQREGPVTPFDGVEDHG